MVTFNHLIQILEPTLPLMKYKLTKQSTTLYYKWRRHRWQHWGVPVAVVTLAHIIAELWRLGFPWQCDTGFDNIYIFFKYAFCMRGFIKLQFDLNTILFHGIRYIYLLLVYVFVYVCAGVCVNMYLYDYMDQYTYCCSLLLILILIISIFTLLMLTLL